MSLGASAFTERQAQNFAQRQASDKDELEASLIIALLRWLNKIKKTDADIMVFVDTLKETLNENYNQIIARVTPVTLRQLDHELDGSSQDALDILLAGWAGAQAVTRSAYIISTLQKFRDSMTFAQWRGKARLHLQSIVAPTEVQPTYENSKHEVGLFVARATAFGKARNKTWITILDGKERPAHHDAALQTVLSVDPFLVGGEQLRFPGDPRGSLGNIIKCRCSMLFT